MMFGTKIRHTVKQVKKDDDKKEVLRVTIWHPNIPDCIYESEDVGHYIQDKSAFRITKRAYRKWIGDEYDLMGHGIVLSVEEGIVSGDIIQCKKTGGFLEYRIEDVF